MAKNKGPRIQVTLECTVCKQTHYRKSSSRYLTTKNRRNTAEKLELKKYCRYCNTHTIHKEIK